jgi:hypothetical protein
MKNIATQVEKHTNSISAVIILANGTVPRVTLGADYALSILSAISPGILAKNAAFLLTNTSNPLYQNLSGDILPEVCKDAPQFLLNNPIALQRRYLKLKNDGGPHTRGQMTHFREMVKASEQDALGVLVGLFDWLDGLDRPKTPNIVMFSTDALAQQMKKRLRKLMEGGIRKVRRIFFKARPMTR